MPDCGFLKRLAAVARQATYGIGLMVGLGGLATTSPGAPLTLYATQFEAAQGFSSSSNLAGQNGWISSGTGGNGLTEWYLEYDQSAYIGFDPPTTNSLYLWKPINHNPTNRPIVTVTLDFAVVDSTTNQPNRDEFRWSVYNIAGARLFSLIFDNGDLGIYHLLDDNVFRYSGWDFTNDPVYTLELQMDFAANRWSAWVEDVQVVTNEFLTTTNASLTFGDVDAVWLAANTNLAGRYVAGDNFMLFDNLHITADIINQAPAVVQTPLPVGGGLYVMTVTGAEGVSYAMEASTNLVDWTALKTNVITGGYFDFLDRGATGLPRRFYRARLVAP